MIRGYWNKPEATAETIVDGWLRSGDIGKMDDEGFIYVQDRAKDMVLRAGENVYCAEVEAALYEHPAVYEAAVYEGYGVGGVAVIVETLSDNKNRTVSEVRNVFSKNNGNLAEKGAVSWMFAQKGLVEVDASIVGEEDLMMAVMDAGGEDIQAADEVFEIFSSVDSFEAVKSALSEADIAYAQASLAWVPQNVLAVEGGDAEKILRLLEGLEDLDDVQKVFSNFDIQEEELAKLLA